MPTVTVHAAKTHLSKLLAAVEAGEEVIIQRGRTPIARLVKIEPKTGRRPGFGALKGVIKLDESFFDPLPEEELAAWE